MAVSITLKSSSSLVLFNDLGIGILRIDQFVISFWTLPVEKALKKFLQNA